MRIPGGDVDEAKVELVPEHVGLGARDVPGNSKLPGLSGAPGILVI